MLPDVRIPRSCRSRNDACYARLILRVFARRPFWNAIEGKLLSCGSRIERQELWPTAEYPAQPLLLEYAGNERPGRHRGPNDLHVLWRYDVQAEDWVEMARFVSATGAEFVESVRPLLRRLLAQDRPANPNAAPDASLRVIEALDYELDILDDDRGARREMLGLLFDRFTARLVREEEMGSGSIGLAG